MAEQASLEEKINRIQIDVAVIKSRLQEITPHHPPCFELQADRRDIMNLTARVERMEDRLNAEEKEKRQRWWEVLMKVLPWLIGALGVAWGSGWRPK